MSPPTCSGLTSDGSPACETTAGRRNLRRGGETVKMFFDKNGLPGKILPGSGLRAAESEAVVQSHQGGESVRQTGVGDGEEPVHGQQEVAHQVDLHPHGAVEAGSSVEVSAAMVNEKLQGLMKNRDLSEYIL